MNKGFLALFTFSTVKLGIFYHVDANDKIEIGFFGGKSMKVLMLNGSPHESGVNDLALREMEAIFQENGIETEIVQVGNLAIHGCTACGACTKLGKCVYDDIVNELAPKFKEADGLVVSSPVYYASANATGV